MDTLSTKPEENVFSMPRPAVYMLADHGLLLDLVGQRPIMFHRSLVDIAGSVNAALWLSWALGVVSAQCEQMRRNGTAPTSDGLLWFESNHIDCERDTGLTRREQDTARRMLRSTKILQERSAHRGKGFSLDLRLLDTQLQQKSAESWADYATLISPVVEPPPVGREKADDAHTSNVRAIAGRGAA